MAEGAIFTREKLLLKMALIPQNNFRSTYHQQSEGRKVKLLYNPGYIGTKALSGLGFSDIERKVEPNFVVGTL